MKHGIFSYLLVNKIINITIQVEYELSQSESIILVFNLLLEDVFLARQKISELIILY